MGGCVWGQRGLEAINKSYSYRNSNIHPALFLCNVHISSVEPKGRERAQRLKQRGLRGWSEVEWGLHSQAFFFCFVLFYCFHVSFPPNSHCLPLHFQLWIFTSVSNIQSFNSFLWQPTKGPNYEPREEKSFRQLPLHLEVLELKMLKFLSSASFYEFALQFININPPYSCFSNILIIFLCSSL